jgi:DDE superfamily endonuclease/Archaeal putative transposase ISC1217
MASINERHPQRTTPTPRRDADDAADRHGAQLPRLSRRRKKRLSREQRRQSARKAGLSRRQFKRICGQLPKPVHAVFEPLAPALTRPTHQRLVLLALAAILTVGGRTIANLLRTLGALAPGHSSSYHRALSHRRWPFRRLARRYIAAVLARFAPRGPVELAGDDTVTEHPGDKVYGKGRHRDPVRSTHSFTAYRWGHKWVVLAVLVRFPFCRRRWALPLLVALYRPEEKGIDGVCRRAHKTPVDLLGQMLRILIRWFPDRTFVCCADGNYAAHELAERAAANPQRLTFVSKFYPDANLFEPPPPVPGKRPAHRPRKKGKELPDPAQVVRDTPSRPVLTVAWYGGQRRRVEVVTGTGSWYRSGRPLVPVRWVFVRDRSGTHRDEYFFTTDVTMSPQAVIATYTGRWNIETTFQDARSYLGLETTRGRSRNTVLRAEPCLLALYTLVVWLYAELPLRYQRVRGVAWLHKSDVTFSDAITAVRRYLWVEGVFTLSGHREAFEKLGGPLRQILLQGLAPVA